MGLYRKYQARRWQFLIFMVIRISWSVDVNILGVNINSCKPVDELEVLEFYVHGFDFMMNFEHGFPFYGVLVPSVQWLDGTRF